MQILLPLPYSSSGFFQTENMAKDLQFQNWFNSYFMLPSHLKMLASSIIRRRATLPFSLETSTDTQSILSFYRYGVLLKQTHCLSLI